MNYSEYKVDLRKPTRRDLVFIIPTILVISTIAVLLSNIHWAVIIASATIAGVISIAFGLGDKKNRAFGYLLSAILAAAITAMAQLFLPV